MSLLWDDGGLSTARIEGQVRVSYPIEAIKAAYILEQDYHQLFADYVALDPRSEPPATHPDDASAYFIGESALIEFEAMILEQVAKHL